jgi:hypothetical protein
MKKNLIFGPGKQDNRPTDVIGSGEKKNDVTSLQPKENRVNPYQIYAQYNLGRTQNLEKTSALSGNGINKENTNNDSASLRNTAASTEWTMSELGFGEELNTEVKRQIIAFKNDMTDFFQKAILEQITKTQKNKETITKMQEDLNSHNQGLSELSKRVNEYKVNLSTVQVLLKSELDNIKTTLLSSPHLSEAEIAELERTFRLQIDNKARYSENQQRDLDIKLGRVREELSRYIQSTVNVNFNENTLDGLNKLAGVSKELASSWAKKLEKVLEHLNGKIFALEKQVDSYATMEDGIVEKARFEIESKIGQTYQRFNEQIRDVRRLIDQKVDVNRIRAMISEVDGDNSEKVNRLKRELETFKQEYASGKDQIKSLESKLQQIQMAIQRELGQLDFDLKNVRQQSQQPFVMTQDQLRRVQQVTSNFEQVSMQQQQLNFEADMGKKHMEEIQKSTANKNIAESDPRIKKLEEIVANLSRTVDLLKNSSSTSNSQYLEHQLPIVHHISYPEYTSQNQNHGNYSSDFQYSTPQPQNNSSFYQNQNSQEQWRYADTNRSDQKMMSTITESTIDDFPSGKKYDFKDISQISSSLPANFEMFRKDDYAHGNRDTYDPLYQPHNESVESFKKVYTRQEPSISYSVSNVTPSKQGQGTTDHKFETFNRGIVSNVDSFNIGSQFSSDGKPPGHSHEPNGHIQGVIAFDPNAILVDDMRSQKSNSNENSQRNSPMIQPTNGLRDRRASEQHSNKSSGSSHIDHVFSNPYSRDDDDVPKSELRYTQDEEEVSVVFQMDDFGYLMDEHGNYIFDDNGNKLKLTEDQLDNLRANKILEDKN